MKSNRNLLLEFIQNYPGSDSGFIKECCEINFSSVSTTLTKLCSDGLILSNGIPKKFFLTDKGKKTLESGGLPGRLSGPRKSAYSLQVATNIGDSFVCRKDIAKLIGCKEENITWVLSLLEHMKAVDVIKMFPIGGRRKVKHYRKNENMPTAIKSFRPEETLFSKIEQADNSECSSVNMTATTNPASDQIISQPAIDPPESSTPLYKTDIEIQKSNTANELAFLESILSPEEFKGYLKGKILGQHCLIQPGDQHVPN